MVKEDLLKYIQDPENPKSNLEIGLHYYKLGHYSSAVSFLHRAAELTDDPLLEYQCMLICSNALYRRGNRPHQVKGFALHAISIMPERPEGWYIYARILEVQNEWQECYTACNAALRLCDFDSSPIYLSDYPGKYAILFEKSISGWHIGRSRETRSTLSYLYNNKDVDASHRELIKNNMIKLGMINE